MTKKDLEKLKAAASAEDWLEMSVAMNGHKKAMATYNEQPGDRTGKDSRAAKEFLEEVYSRLMGKYFPADAEVDRFKNRKASLDWLKSEGHKVSTGKFYGDCDKGLVRVNSDGSVSSFSVAMYARQLDKAVAPVPEAIDKGEDERRKAKADADIAEMKAEAMRREEDSLWLHADLAWSTLAATVGNLRDALRRAVHGAQVDIVLAAGGEIARAPETYEKIEMVIDAAFNDVAKNGFDVQWAEEDR